MGPISPINPRNMPPPGVGRLREHMHRHNRWVLLLTLLTILLSIVLWAFLYLIVWWVFLIGGTAGGSVDFHPTPIFRSFAAIAVLLCLFAAIGRRLHPNAAPRDHRGFGEHLMDVLLAVPRLTLSIFGTGGAAARLTNAELRYAWNLLRRMDDADAPIPVQYLPVEIPNPSMRNRIILALQLSGLIEIRTTDDGAVLAFQNNDARKIAEERVRLQV